MQFEVEVHRNELGEWVALAVAWGIEATGRTEKAIERLLARAREQFRRMWLA